MRYNNHNSGAMRYVTIRRSSGLGSVGAIGLGMAETEFGLGLIKDVTIDGFDLGILTPGQPSHATFENISLRNQQVLGFRNNLPVSIYSLRSENTVPMIENRPGLLAQLVLIEAELNGDADTSATINRGSGSLVLRDIEAIAYANIL